MLFLASGYYKQGCYEHGGVCVLVVWWESFRYIPESGKAGSLGSTISNFLWNRQIEFQSSCAGLQSHQQWTSVPLSPHLSQHVLTRELWILAILIVMK